MRLLWLEYKNFDIREVYICHLHPYYEKERVEKVHKFTAADGMISNIKLVKSISDQTRNDKYIFWVKNGTQVVRFNIETKSSELVGEAPDTIIAFHVQSGHIR